MAGLRNIRTGGGEGGEERIEEDRERNDGDDLLQMFKVRDE